MQKLMELKEIEDKRNKEKEVVEKMVKIYCKGNKHGGDGLCTECEELLSYANMRVDRCPFMETKTFCQNCKVHCYNQAMRSKIKEVMRYSGPRLIFRHPIMTISHGIESYKDKRRSKIDKQEVAKETGGI